MPALNCGHLSFISSPFALAREIPTVKLDSRRFMVGNAWRQIIASPAFGNRMKKNGAILG